MVVKFAHRYNREVHAMLEAASLAPKLRYCHALEPDVGLWVIVMDYITEEVAEERLTSPVPLHIDSLRTAVLMVHKRGFVFGGQTCSSCATGLCSLTLTGAGRTARRGI